MGERANVSKYFAYGSNMLLKRMHVNNNTSKKLGIGKLKGYRLTFSGVSQLWCGPTATITKDEDHHSWGVIYEIPVDDIHKLDQQECLYERVTVEVEDTTGALSECFAYQLKSENFSDQQYPSKCYKAVVVNGALENGLPDYYINFLKNYNDNNEEGPKEFLEDMLALKL